MFDHVSPLLKELHWLRVPERITFQLAVLAYRCQHNMAPRYLTAQLQRIATLVTGSIYTRRHRPCLMFLSLNMWLSVAVHSVQACVWNSLPTAVQSSESLDIFQCRLKTELFKRSYNWHRACQTTLLLCDSLSLSRSFFAVAATLKSIDYNVAMTFVLNNNNNMADHDLLILNAEDAQGTAANERPHTV